MWAEPLGQAGRRSGPPNPASQPYTRSNAPASQPRSPMAAPLSPGHPLPSHPQGGDTAPGQGARRSRCRRSSLLVLRCGHGIAEGLARCRAVPAPCQGTRCQELTHGDVTVTAAAKQSPPAPSLTLPRNRAETMGCSIAAPAPGPAHPPPQCLLLGWPSSPYILNNNIQIIRLFLQ